MPQGSIVKRLKAQSRTAPEIIYPHDRRGGLGNNEDTAVISRFFLSSSSSSFLKHTAMNNNRESKNEVMVSCAPTGAPTEEMQRKG